ncbi:MAG: hypothetical protein E7494_15540 [Ruminococcus albus]|nr:hypothetical protein [Ruminococcus albus]
METKKTDTFELRLIPKTVDVWDDQATPLSFIGVDYYINGVSMLDMIRKIEQPYCDAEGIPELACDYELNPQIVMQREFAKIFDPELYKDSEGFELYCCPDCGLSFCWSVCCKFEENGMYILMKDFFHNHREWEYPFEFQFTKDNFFSEISKLETYNDHIK